MVKVIQMTGCKFSYIILQHVILNNVFCNQGHDLLFNEIFNSYHDAFNGYYCKLVLRVLFDGLLQVE